MKRLASVLFIGLALNVWPSGPAFAQPSCWPDLRIPIEARSAGAPARIGEIVYAVSSTGMVWGYACIRADGSIRYNVAGGPWSAFPPDWAAIAYQLALGTHEQRAEAWRKYVTSSTIDARLKAELDSVIVRLPPPPPPPTPSPPAPPPAPEPRWVVAPTTICAAQDKEGGVCVRRQSFAWDGKTRGTVAQPERATIGAPCITSIGAEPYFGFDAQRTDRVVLCARK